MTQPLIPGHWYTDGKRTFQVIAFEEPRVLVHFHGEPAPVRRYISTMQALAEPVDGPPETSPPPAPRARRPQPDRDRYFRVDETSPLIAELIRRHAPADGSYLTRQEIVQFILADPRGRANVDKAIERGINRTPAAAAGNMVDHFSKDITNRTSEFTGRFDRRKIGGMWAYRPQT